MRGPLRLQVFAVRWHPPGALHDEAQRGELAGPVADERLVVLQAARLPVKLGLPARSPHARSARQP